MKPRLSLRKALNDKLLLGKSLTGDSWQAWRVLLIAAMGEKLTNDERELFKQLTNREHEPEQRVEEFVGVIGRRGGKSRAISVLATYISGLCQHPSLVPGERGVVLVVAPDQKQADITLDYVEASFRTSPILSPLVETRVARSIKLTNRIDIIVRASDFRTLRGMTFVAAICDESAFWMTENSTNPDTEILNAIRPGLATTSGPLFMISSPYARRGELWNTYNKHFGPAGDPAILVAQAASRTMNPSLPQSVVDRAIERDAASADAEFGAQFRTNLEAFVNIEAVRACVSAGVFERAPIPGVSYAGFVDPAGGSGADSMTLAIGHIDYAKQIVIVDAVRERKPPFSPEQVTSEFAAVLQQYHVTKVIGDKYAGGFPPEQFGKFNILYEQSAKPRSDLYVDLLPMINSCRIALLDNQKLVSQLTALERRSGRSGRDQIDHPPNGHDDVANAVAGLASINTQYPAYDSSFRGWSDDEVRRFGGVVTESSDDLLLQRHGAGVGGSVGSFALGVVNCAVHWLSRPNGISAQVEDVAREALTLIAGSRSLAAGIRVPR
jgi:hypothetical protein